MSDKETKIRWWKRPVVIGWIATAVLTGFFVYSMTLSDCRTMLILGEVKSVCTSKWGELRTASPNEIGDTLAGVAGTLAFLWIVVTVWLQSQELAEQRKELKLTRDELEGQKEATQAMAKAQAEQVRLLEVQGKIFIDEQKQRREDRAERLLEQLLENLDFLVTNERELAETWTSCVDGGRPRRHSFFYADLSKTPEQRIAEISEVAETRADGIIQTVSAFGKSAKSGQKEYFLKIELLLSEIESIKASLAEHQLARLRKLNIASLFAAVRRLVAADIWSELEEKREE